MINLLHRYIFKELLISIGISFCFFLFVLLMGETIRDLSELLTSGKLGFKLFFQLIALLIPHLAIFAIPFAVLSGILIGLGRLCADEEITAMKASGFSLYQISSSVFFIAFLGMLISAAFSLHYGPKSSLAYRSLIAQSLVDNPLGCIQEKKFVKDQLHKIYTSHLLRPPSVTQSHPERIGGRVLHGRRDAIVGLPTHFEGS